MKAFFIATIISIASASAALAQTAGVYPESAIPNFKCWAHLTHYSINGSGIMKEMGAETLQLGEIKPIYYADPKYPVTIPPIQGLLKFSKFPLFAKATMVIFWHSDKKEMNINLFSTYSDKENPTYPSVFPNPISTSYLKNLNWNLQKHFDAIYTAVSIQDGPKNQYSLSMHCGAIGREATNTPLADSKKRPSGVIQIGNQFVKLAR